MFFIFIATTSYTASVKPYRNDYSYSSKTNAFFKFHTDEASSADASTICSVEGAALIVPILEHDIAQAHAMLKDYPDIGNNVWVADDGNSHESAEEPALIDLDSSREEWYSEGQCTVLTRNGEVASYDCGMKLPFICKVSAEDAYHDDKCGVYATGYKYIESVGSCYKIPRISYSWNQAFAECKAEGAHLVVLNSDAESRAVKTLMTDTRFIPDTHSIYYYIAGIRANKPTDGTPRVFRTIFNETLEEAGFAKWADTEPNNLNDSEYCGSLYETDGLYNDQDCSHTYGFICEKEVHL